MGGALIRHGDGLVLVGNRRRDRSLEWTPPGGVIDPGETVNVPIEWENLVESLPWQLTPVARNASFPGRVAVYGF